MAGDVDVNSGKFAVTASDGSLAISSNKFTVAGDTGNTVVAGTLNATGAATLSSTLDVAGDVDVNSGKFAVTASDGSLAISSNKFTVAGDTGNTVVAGTLNATGAATLSSTLDVAGDVDVNSGKFAVTASDGSLAISSNKFTVAGDTGNTVVAGTLNATGAATLSSTLDVAGDVDVNSGKFTVDASTGNTVVAGSLDAGSMTVTSLSMVSASISGTMDVAGASNLTSTLSVSGAVTLLDDLEMSKQSVALTHSGSTGGGLSITSTNGYVEISSTASYVDVESVRVTGAQMGVSGDTDIITLSSASGVGNVAIAGELNVSLDVDVGSSAFVVTASDGSLAISSNKFTVAGDTGNTVVAGTLT